MAHQAENSEDKFRTLRNEFDDLQIEKKATFLLESGISFLTHGIDSITRFVQDEFNKMASDAGDNSADEERSVADDSEFARDIADEDDSDNRADKEE